MIKMVPTGRNNARERAFISPKRSSQGRVWGFSLNSHLRDRALRWGVRSFPALLTIRLT